MLLLVQLPQYRWFVTAHPYWHTKTQALHGVKESIHSTIACTSDYHHVFGQTQAGQRFMPAFSRSLSCMTAAPRGLEVPPTIPWIVDSIAESLLCAAVTAASCSMPMAAYSSAFSLASGNRAMNLR